MSGKHTLNNEAENAVAEQTEARLKAVLDNLPRKVPVLLFKKREDDDLFSSAASEVLRSLKNISSKIELYEYDAGHKLVKKWEITNFPVILFDPEKYSIKWMGAPIGEEGRTLVEALVLLGSEDTGLSEQALKILTRITEPGK